MRICHVSMFAPSRCGLYEASRDMARADIAGGNEVIFIDVGITVNGQRQAPQVGAVDDRAGFRLETADPSMIQTADIIVMHTGASDNWLVKSDAPLIWVIHGRPLACFRPESVGKGASYTLYGDVSKWQRTAKMLYFWPEFKPHWDVIIPEEKHLVLDYPVIDQNRFCPEGPKYQIEDPGDVNFLICDSNREDIDNYELGVGCIEAAKNNTTGKKLKFHFIGIDYPMAECWKALLKGLEKYDALGDVKPRTTKMDEVYRAMDCLLSPNRIIVRTIAEAQSCGLPVIKETSYTPMAYSYSVSSEILSFAQYSDKVIAKEAAIEFAKNYSTENYYTKMNEVYKEVLGR